MEKQLIKKIEFNQYRTVVYKKYCSLENKPYGINSDIQYVKRTPLWEYESADNTIECYLQNYNNLCSSIYHDSVKILTEKYQNKISLKIFLNVRTRQLSSRFFKKNTRLFFLTYNFETNDLYVGKLTNYHKKRKKNKTIRRNDYKGTFESFTVKVRRILNQFDDFNSLFVKQQNEMVNSIYHSFLQEFPEWKMDIPLSETDSFLYKNYLLKKNIKFPNNFASFMNLYPQPTLKIYRKCKNKMVEGFMYINGLKGKKINAILNEVKLVNFEFFKYTISLFGYEYIISKSKEDIKKILEYPNFFSGTPGVNSEFKSIIDIMTRIEKDRVYNVMFDNSDDIGLWTFLDHIQFYHIINKYEKIKWLSKTSEEFKQEHLTWSAKVDEIKNYIVTRHYDENLLKYIEIPIDTLGVKYYPKVLTKNTDYLEESLTQSNCVKTYKQKARSLIISLRKGDLFSKERLTIECIFTKSDKNEIILKRIQTRARFNEPPGDNWNKVLQIIDFRLYSHLYLHNMVLPSITIENKYEVKTYNSYFDENGNLSWIDFDENQIQINNNELNVLFEF